MKRFAFLLMMGGAVLGCRKEDVMVCDPTITCESFAGTIADLRAAAPPVQTFDVDLSQAQSLKTKAGAILTFEANAWAQPDSSVATGRAIIRVRELRSAGEMLLAGLHTNVFYTSSHLLATAGEFNVQAWQGTTRLRWKKEALVTTAFPTLTIPTNWEVSDTARMFFWRLDTYYVPVRVSGWSNGSILPPVLQSGPGTTPRTGVYRAALHSPDSTSWWSFAQFWPYYDYRQAWDMADIVVPAGATRTLVYLQPIGVPALARTTDSAAAPNHWLGYLPNGTNARAIVVQERNSQLYYGTQAYVQGPGTVILPTLELLCPDEIIRRIRLL